MKYEKKNSYLKCEKFNLHLYLEFYKSLIKDMFLDASCIANERFKSRKRLLQFATEGNICRLNFSYSIPAPCETF